LNYRRPFLLVPEDGGSKYGDLDGCSGAMPVSEVGTSRWLIDRKTDTDFERYRVAN